MKELNTKAFDEYVSNYDMNDAAIDRKFHHTYRVTENCLNIAEGLNLNEDEKYIAGLCGLLHDIGRFEQWRIYGTYQDWNSVDHGDKGVEVLLENNLFEKFEEDQRIKDIVLFAIKNHNKREVEATNDEEKILFTKIIRDADKIDIMLTQHNTLKEEKSVLNEYFLKDLLNGETCNRVNFKNDIDSVLSQIGFLFDINYKQSFKLIKDKKIIEQKFEILKHSIDDPRVEKLEKYIFEYMNRKLED